MIYAAVLTRHSRHMKCIISGGTGFIGRRVVDRLLRNSHYVGVWSRKPGLDRRTAVATHIWDPLAGDPPLESLNGMDCVIHLAGENVAQRWTPEVKRRIRDSRVLSTQSIVDSIGLVRHKPHILVCASAIGIYGDRGDEILSEASVPGSGFLADTCRAWEAEADRACRYGMRVVKIRIGFVLGKDGGALQKMVPAFRAFVGGKLGSGKQWMPWIHVDDVAEIFGHAVESEISGVWNATAPNPVRNSEFTRELARALGRPALFPVPPIALKLAFGEFAQHMIDSARVVPENLTKAGFPFRHPDLAPALENILA
jgi:uncharacterized protein (TIGR01777 family)